MAEAIKAKPQYARKYKENSCIMGVLCYIVIYQYLNNCVI